MVRAKVGGAPVGTFNSKDVASASSVSFTGLNLSGAQASNYILSPYPNMPYAITKRPLAISGSRIADKVFDGTTLASLTPGTLSGLIGSETLTFTARAAFGAREAGTYTITASYTLVDGMNGGLATNYLLADEILTASITALPVISPTQLITPPVVVPPQLVVPPGTNSNWPQISIPPVTGAIGGTGTGAPRSGGTGGSTGGGVTPVGGGSGGTSGGGSGVGSSAAASGSGGASGTSSAATASTSGGTASGGSTSASGAASGTPTTSATSAAVPSGQTVQLQVVEAEVVPISRPGSATSDAVTGFVAVKTLAPLRAPAGSSFTFVVAEDTFKHSQTSAEIAVSAQTTDGQALPDWLKFIPGERRFVGTAPPNVTQFQVRVVARDERGEQVATTITLNFDN